MMFLFWFWPCTRTLTEALKAFQLPSDMSQDHSFTRTCTIVITENVRRVEANLLGCTLHLAYWTFPRDIEIEPRYFTNTVP